MFFKKNCYTNYNYFPVEVQPKKEDDAPTDVEQENREKEELMEKQLIADLQQAKRKAKEMKKTADEMLQKKKLIKKEYEVLKAISKDQE